MGEEKDLAFVNIDIGVIWVHQTSLNVDGFTAEF